MKQITIRIERRTLHLAETETRGDRIEIRSVRSFPLPENMENGACTDDPEALAAFTAEMIKRGRLTPAPAVLLFNSEIAIHREYYHQGMSAREMSARVSAEAESFLPAGLGAYILESERYNPKHASEDRTSAIFAVKDGFLRGFVKSLKSLGVKCRFASSSLSVSSDSARNLLNTLMKNDIRPGSNPISLNIGEDCMRFLLFTDARLTHRRETPVPEGLSDDELLLFAEEETKGLLLHVGNRENNANMRADCILLSGDRALAPDFADRLAGRLNTPCRYWGDYTDNIRDTDDKRSFYL
jgi:Tfp pilus assembly PilM family ATPase